MRMLIAAVVLVLLGVSPASAQVAKVVKEGVEAAAKKAFGRAATKTSQEAAEQAFKKTASAALREAGRESVEAAARKAGTVLLRQSDDIARVAGKHGSAIVAPLVNSFGDDGARALMKLSPTSARRMAMLTEDFASAGRGADWMRIIAEKGDIAAEWIWKNKGALTVAATATAFLANPDPFLQAGEVVATTGIKTAGEHVAHPLIEGTVTTLAPQVAREIARPAVALAEASGRSAMVLFLLLTFAGCGVAMLYGRLIRPWRRHKS